MELIIWCAGAVVLGAILGYLGYLYSKLAYSIFTTSMAAIVFLAGTLVRLTGGDVTGMARSSVDQSAYGFGLMRQVFSAIDKMNYLPFHVQVAILVFAVTFFLSRIATWAGKSYGPKKAEETPAERKARILKSYGMKSMDDIRTLR